MTLPIEFPHISRLTIKVTPAEDKRGPRATLSFEVPLEPNHLSQVLLLVARGQPLSVSFNFPQAELPLGEVIPEVGTEPAPYNPRRRHR